MALTQNTYTGDGSTVLFSFTFPYLTTTDIKVSVNDVDTTAYSLANATTVQFSSAPASGAAIRIFRDTNVDSLNAEFFSGSAIRASDLNNDFNQILYSTQETVNRRVNSTGDDMTGDLTMVNADIVFEGSTNDANETTLTVVDPTADRTITLPNVSGTVVTTGDTGTVSTAMVADSAITSAKIGANQVNGTHYAPASIDTPELIDGAVTTAKLAADAVTGSKLAHNSVNSEHYVTGSIDHDHIGDAQVTTAKIANDAVTSDKLAHTAVTPGNYTAADITVDAQGRITAASNGAIGTSEITNGAVTADKIVDGAILEQKLASNVISNAKMQNNSVNTAEIVDGAVSTGKIADANITTAKIANNAVTNDKLADAELVELATMASGTASALADLTQTEVQILDGATLTTNELNTLDGVTSTTAEINILDGVTSNASELNTLDGITASTAELNQLDGKTISSTFTPANSNDIPTSAAINTYVSGLLNSLGGFVAIPNENSFPTTNPDPSDNAGTIVSIANAGGMSINGSGVGTGQTTAGTAVTITGFPSTFNSTTIQDGLGLQVQTTSTLNTYTYHKVYAKDEDVRQLSQDVNDFKARYRVGASNPTTDLDSGDLFFNTGSGKMLVYNGQNSAWEEVQSIGEFFINTLSSSSGTGGGSATFNGSAYRFTLSNAPTNAEQLLVSVNGVVQKPNSGTSQPSEGFAIDGSDIIFSAAPAASSPFFVITIGSAVNIGTPSAGTVGTNQLATSAVTNAKVSSSAAIAQSKLDLSITNAEVNASADIAGSKLADDSIGEVKLDIHNAPSAGKFLQYDGTNGMQWGDVPAGVGGANGVDFNDNVKARFGTGNDLEIYHDGTKSYIADAGPGSLRILSDDLRFYNAANNEFMARFQQDGAATLYFDGNPKFVTKSDGIDVTGEVQCDSLDVNGSSNLLGNLNLGDNNRVRLGLNADLDVYHNGSQNLVESAAGQVLEVRASTLQVTDSGGTENLLRAVGDGACELFHNGTKRFETLSNGGKLTGRFHINGLNGAIDYNNTAHTLEYIVNGGTHSELNTSAYVPATNAGKHLGHANKRWNNVYANGILFGGDSAAANTLEDYEEGTFTPEWTTTGTNFSSVTYSHQTGNYTKIGNLVHVSLKLRSIASSGGSGGLLIGGLPFQINDTTGAGGGSPAFHNINVNNSAVNISVETRNGTSQFYMLASVDDGMWSNVQHNNIRGSSVSEMRVSFAYITNS